MMRLPRPRAVLAAIAVIGALTGVLVRAWRERPVMTPEAAQHIAEARRWADSLERTIRTAHADSIGVADAIAAGYLARQRVGLGGGPFRLIELASCDPLLGDSLRRTVEWALLARALDGRGYHAPFPALDLIGAPTGTARRVSGAWHESHIDREVMRAAESTGDPRVGELAVRLAYRLASSAGRVSHRAPSIAIEVAALARDRVLARADAARLLARARVEQVDPLALVVRWRAERRLAVERPVLARLSAREERAALDRVAPLLAAIDSVADPALAADDAPSPRDEGPLGEGASRRLAGLALVRDAPPQAAVAVAVAGYRQSVAAAGADEATRRAAAWFGAHARNEETLVAAWGLVAARDGAASSSALVGPALATLWAAVSMRALAQEPVWFPGDPGPSDADLAGRWGVATVRFDAGVPDAWRPYYRRMLDLSLTDLRRVLPNFQVRGLTVRFGESPAEGAALALHDPGTRTLYLPLATGAGVIAHELAHDLDWQVARARYGRDVRAYGTDLAVRAPVGPGDGRLAASVLELASVGMSGFSAGAPAPAEPSRRPTELFARNVDWFVTASLAHQGRVNGYLSAVQDAELAGYAAAGTPEISRQGGEAIVGALDEMTAIASETRAWFLSTYGRERAIPAYELARRVLEMPLSYGALRAVESHDPIGAGAGPLLASLVGGAAHHALESSCAPWRAGVDDDALGHARARLVELAAESRAQGIARRRAAWLALRGGASGPLRALDPMLAAAPWNPEWRDAAIEGTTSRIRDLLVEAASRDLLRGAAAVTAASTLGACVD